MLIERHIIAACLVLGMPSVGYAEVTSNSGVISADRAGHDPALEQTQNASTRSPAKGETISGHAGSPSAPDPAATAPRPTASLSAPVGRMSGKPGELGTPLETPLGRTAGPTGNATIDGPSRAATAHDAVPKIKIVDAESNPPDPASDIDFSALRYYIAQKNTAHINAEIRLLRSKHPQWRPSKDLFAQLMNEEIEQPLWDLYNKQDFVTLQAKLAELKVSRSPWQPSERLTNKLALGEARHALIAASDGQLWRDVVEIAAGKAGLVTASDLDLLWRTAEALAHVGDPDQAGDIYAFVLRTNNVSAERMATVQKASLLLKSPQLDRLLAMGVRGSDGSSEFEQIQLDMLRGKIGAAISDTHGAETDAHDLAMLSGTFERSRNTDDAQLLGWYFYSHKHMREAEIWFRKALAIRPEGKSVEGLVLALRQQGKIDEAQKLAFDPNNLGIVKGAELIALYNTVIAGPKLYPVAPKQLSAFAEAIDSEKSADGAQALGWYRFKLNDLSAAQTWFKKSGQWKNSESAAVGLLLCAKKLNQVPEFNRVAELYRKEYPRIGQLELAMRPKPPTVHVAAGDNVEAHKPIARVRTDKPNARARTGQSRDGDDTGWDRSADEIVKAFQGGSYDRALALLDARQRQKPDPKGLAVVRGWALFHKGDWSGARQVFNGVEKNGSPVEAQNALRVLDQAETPQRFR